MIVHDAAALFVTVIDRAFLVVQVAAGFAAMVGCAGILLVAPGVKAARKRVSGPSWARGRVRARIHARKRTRPTRGRTRAPWVHDQPVNHDDYQEAA